jgi:hypothetical protein
MNYKNIIMILTEIQKKDILSKFPNIKLSYGNILHNKVCNSDIMLAIPEGNKCFIWFTKYKEKYVCFIIELFKNKYIKEIKVIDNFFNDTFSKDTSLSEGTIFYGTLFYINKNKFFTIEDIFYYKDINVKYNNWFEKYVLLKKIISSEIKQSNIIFGLPILSNNFDNLINKIKTIKYKIHIIQFKYFKKCNNFLYIHYQYLNENLNQNKNYKIDNRKTYNYKPHNNKISKKNITYIFNVVPDIQNDIYYLKCNNNNSLIFYDIAHIPDFKTSLLMNKLFRNIKENDNLDTLEESDDENEFENDNPNKFVYLDKNYNMLCTFCNKFKKWIPIKLADENLSVINIKDLQTK